MAVAQAQDGGGFTSSVYPVFQAAQCRGCHVESGLAGSTRLRFPPADASPEQIERFGRGLAALVDRAAPEQSLLIRKPTNREKHTGGQLIQPGSAEEATLLGWIRSLAASAPPAAEPKPNQAEAQPRLTLRRLTHSQYNNTVRDLLEDETRPADSFPPEDFVNGFKNQIAAQDISPLLAESYNNAAERLAKSAFQGGTDERGLIPCKPGSPQDAKCRASFVRSFGLRAFRRPLTDVEQSRYEKTFQAGAARSGRFLDGAQIVIEAMLQSPKFLFRIERGSAPEHRGYEIASRLSYFLWDTMPDESLFRSAASGELTGAGGLDAAVQRMLKDPRARQAVDEFASQWLRFDQIRNAVKDRTLYRQFTPELGAAMAEETRLLISDIVWNERSFMELFTAGYGFLNSDLAPLYELPAPPVEFAKTAYPADSDRAGVIGQAMFLAMTSKPGETSPTIRGAFVRDQFLCQPVPDPPPGLNSSLPPLNEHRPQTNRERLSEHVINPSCAGCHKLMDPIGFGLEGFDAIGRRRDKQVILFTPDRTQRGKKTVKVELPLDTTGLVAGISDSSFNTPKELGQILAKSPACQECVVKQMFRYAFGRRETDRDRPLIDEATAVFRNSRFRLTALMSYLGKALTYPEGRT
jgi:hypothetical protein